MINHTSLSADQTEHALLAKSSITRSALGPILIGQVKTFLRCSCSIIIEMLETCHLKLIPSSKGFRTKD